MKYPLEEHNAMDSLLGWMCRYLRYKATTLSNRLITDIEIFEKELENLAGGKLTFKQLQTSAKSLRNAGLIGINTYAKPLFALFEFLSKKPNFRLSLIDDEMLSDFLAIYTSALSPQTRKNYRIALINFFKYIDKNQESKNIHVFGIELPIHSLKNLKPKIPAYLKEEEIYAFLEALKAFPFSPKIKARDTLIILLIIHTGVRVSEILLLQKKNLIIDGDLCMLNIIGKGGKSRSVAVLTSVVQEHLAQWLSIRANLKSVQNHLLFCNQKGGALSQAYVYRCVESVLLYAGIKKPKMGAHLLRHSFATLLYQKHKDLILVQESLGHADLNTSRIYTHFDKDKLKKTASLIQKPGDS